MILRQTSGRNNRNMVQKVLVNGQVTRVAAVHPASGVEVSVVNAETGEHYSLILGRTEIEKLLSAYTEQVPV